MVELLVIIAVIAILIGLLLPSLTTARRHARTAQCASNLRQICIALHNYAATSKGWFPPNVSGGNPAFWYDEDRIGRCLAGDRFDGRVIGGALSCPDDDNALRSYSMNVWASSKVNPSVLAAPARGELFNSGVKGAERTVLVTEAHSGFTLMTIGLWASAATVGYAGETPGPRFGGGGGISPPLTGSVGRFAPQVTELAFGRHRGRRGAPAPTINIGYADGHVALKHSTELADPVTGLSTLDTWWSPLDPQINKQP